MGIKKTNLYRITADSIRWKPTIDHKNLRKIVGFAPCDPAASHISRLHGFPGKGSSELVVILNELEILFILESSLCDYFNRKRLRPG